MDKPANAAQLLRKLEADKAVLEARRLREAGQIAEASALVARTVQANPDHVGALRLMGLLAMQTGAADLAVHCFSRAHQQEPRSTDILQQLGDAYLGCNNPADAAVAFRKAIDLRQNDGGAWRGLAQAQLELGDSTNALRSFRKTLSILPYDQYAAHMVAGLAGEAVSSALPYVPELFNRYADMFDEHLTETLNYRIPELIAASIPQRRYASALDLGCGTGLVGLALGKVVATIDGIDIAAEMIAKSNERAIYRHLGTGDLTELLQKDTEFSGPYNLVTAADVFIYVGRLEAALAAIRPRMARDAVMAFSVETLERGEVAIRASGRFAHGTSYLQQLARQHALSVDKIIDTPIRHERNQPIPGQLWIVSAA